MEELDDLSCKLKRGAPLSTIHAITSSTPSQIVTVILPGRDALLLNKISIKHPAASPTNREGSRVIPKSLLAEKTIQVWALLNALKAGLMPVENWEMAISPEPTSSGPLNKNCQMNRKAITGPIWSGRNIEQVEIAAAPPCSSPPPAHPRSGRSAQHDCPGPQPAQNHIGAGKLLEHEGDGNENPRPHDHGHIEGSRLEKSKMANERWRTQNILQTFRWEDCWQGQSFDHGWVSRGDSS